MAVTVQVDLTPLTAVQEALRESNELLALFMRFSPIYSYIKEVTPTGSRVLQASENCILLDGNQRLGEIHGYNVAEMIGRPISDFVAPESQEWVAEQMQTNVGTIYESLGLRKEIGTLFPSEIHPRAGTWMGRATRITALRDLAETKQVAARLRAQNDELAHVQSLALISEISAGIIHQLGQPLSAIGANLSAMVMTKAAELAQCEVLPIIRDVKADVARMRDIVIHLRALAKVPHRRSRQYPHWPAVGCRNSNLQADPGRQLWLILPADLIVRSQPITQALLRRSSKPVSSKPTSALVGSGTVV